MPQRRRRTFEVRESHCCGRMSLRLIEDREHSEIWECTFCRYGRRCWIKENNDWLTSPKLRADTKVRRGRARNSYT